MTDMAFHTHTGRETTLIKPVTKSATAYRTISEAADELAVPQHVLRFWETKFNQIRPMKRSGGRRFYRPEDIDLLQHIKTLLYDNGYTIKGVQRLLKLRRGLAGVLESMADEADVPDITDDLFAAIPDHLPAKPAALMASGIAEGRHLPVEEKLEVRGAVADVPATGLSLSPAQRQALGALLDELRMLKGMLA